MNPFRRVDHAETERLLDAARADLGATSDRTGRGGDAASPQARVPTSPGPSTDPVAGLLAAAAGPARPGELAGEEAALAAFRAARADPTPSVPQRPRRRRLTTGAVAWIGAVAVTATAGAAFAAVTRDRAPEPVAPQPSRTSPSPEGSAPASGEPSRSAPHGPPSPGHPSSGAPLPGPPSAGLPSPGTPSAPGAPAGDLHGLCRAWQDEKPEEREKALRTPAFERLVAAAGGPAEVEAYCQRLVPERKPSEPAKPGPPAPPTGRRTHR
ncbi:hypothetical protein AB0A95_33770 [Micromonospora sp. NPDC049230]|uniref:hypothetical protein n=1 Tax=Micromonospora sp. NPDC049230 TaxID=3155502 RepID=UPI0033D8D63E